MTVAELMKILADLPGDAVVVHETGEYTGDLRPVETTTYYWKAALGVFPNTLVLK